MRKGKPETLTTTSRLKPKLKVLVVTVDYDGWDETHKLLNSLEKFDKVDLHLCIVFNSKNGPNKHISNKHNLKMIHPGTNSGYFGGIKIGLSNFNTDEFDYTIVCNNDIKIEQENFFMLLDEYSKCKTYDVIAPSIKTQEGTEQNPHRIKKPSEFKLFLYKIYFSSFYIAYMILLIRFIARGFVKKKKLHNKIEVFSPHGSFIIFKKSYFLKGGIIDDGVFLYGEEDSIAGECYENDMKVIFDPGLRVIHAESATLGKKFTKFKWRHQKKSFYYVLEKYFNKMKE